MTSLDNLRQLLAQGDVDLALSQCRTVLAVPDANPDLIALLGLLLAQRQNFEEARRCLERLDDEQLLISPAALNDLAGIHILLKQPCQALSLLDKALGIAPDFAPAKARRGVALMQQWRFAEAHGQLQDILRESPEHQKSAIHVNLARCALAMGDNDQSIQHIDIARSFGGNSLEQWLQVAVDAYIGLKLFDRAENAIEDALNAGLSDNKIAKLLALVLAGQDKQDQAEHSLRTILKKHPDDIDLMTQLAQLARTQGHFGEAVRWLKAAIRVEPENAALWAQLAHLAQRHFDENTARQAAEKALSLTEDESGIRRVEAFVAMAETVEDKIQSENYFRQALSITPDFVPAQLGLGHLLLQWGHIDHATVIFKEVAERHPVVGYGALMNARKFPDDPEILAHIERIAYLPGFQGSVSSSLLFDLAAAWENRQDYAKAFGFAQAANSAIRKRLTFSPSKHRAYCQKLCQTFTRQFLSTHSEHGHSSTLPTFIVGMPRSGTTLVEQILGCHPEIHVAGEIAVLGRVIGGLNAWERHIGSGSAYPACARDLTARQIQYYAEEILVELRQYSQDARHVVDKLPHNFEHVGLIRLLFPNAPIIHVQREPRDVAISNYFTDYQAKFGGMGFAYDLADIGEHLLDYQRLMRHWNSVLQKPILTVRYEDLIADIETSARQLLDYLQLPWTDSVLSFQDLHRPVKTASVWQVRQPIYQSSKDKWRRYAPFLQELDEILSHPLPDIDDREDTNALPPGYFFQGMAYLKSGDLSQAHHVFRRILAQNPRHAAALHMLGITCLQQGEPIIALKFVKRAIRQQPNHASWHRNLATILRTLDRLKEAESAEIQAAKLQARDLGNFEALY